MSQLSVPQLQQFAFVPCGLGVSADRPWLSSNNSDYCRARSQSRLCRIHPTPTRSRAKHGPILQPECSSATSSSKAGSLFTWLSENGAKVAKQVNASPRDARRKLGVCLNGALSKGTQVAVLPECVYLTSRCAKAALQGEVPGIAEMDGAGELSDASWLALQVVYERCKGEESRYARLIDSLPGMGCLDSLGLWSEVELEWLTGCGVKGRAEEVREGVAEEWGVLLDGGLVGKLMGGVVGEEGLEMYRWGVGVVDERGVNVGGEIVVGPVVGQCVVGGVGKRNARVEVVTTGLLRNKRMVRVVVERDVGEGEEICLGVGGLGNADLLLERGFVVEEEGADMVEMCFALTRMDRFYEDKIDVVEQFAEGGEREGDVMRFELRDDGEGVWTAPEGMEAFVRLVCLGGTDAFLLEAVFRNEVWGHMQLAVSAENEKAMCDLVVGACEDALEGYDAGAAGVAGEGEDEAGRARAAMAERIVGAEKRILQRVAKAYRDRANSLDALEYYAERRLNALDLLRPVDECEIVDSDSGVRVGRAFDENYY